MFNSRHLIVVTNLVELDFSESVSEKTNYFEWGMRREFVRESTS